MDILFASSVISTKKSLARTALDNPVQILKQDIQKTAIERDDASLRELYQGEPLSVRAIATAWDVTNANASQRVRRVAKSGRFRRVGPRRGINVRWEPIDDEELGIE